MRIVRKSYFAGAVLLMALPVWAQTGGEKPAEKPTEKPAATAAPKGAEIGKPAPDFALKDLDGKEHKLSSYKGKIVVLEWTNHECPFCKNHYKAKTMQNTFNKFKDKGVVWLTVDSSNFADQKAETIKTWWKEQGNPFPYLLDAPGKVGKSFGAQTTPHVFVIDAKGNLAYSGAIDDNADGNKPTPKNYVAEAIDALAKGSTVPTATTKPYGCTVKYKE